MKRLQNIGLLLCFCLIDLSVLATTPLEKQLQQAKHDTTRIRICIEIAQEYNFREPPDSSLKFIKTGFALARTLKAPIYFAELHNIYAMYFEEKEQLENSINEYKKAAYWAQKNKQYKSLSNINYNIGRLYTDLSRNTGRSVFHKEAIRQINNNLKFDQYHHFKDGLFFNSKLLATTYQYYGNDSLYYYYKNKALELNIAPKNLGDSLMLWADKLGIHLYNHQLNKATYFSGQILRYKNRIEDVTYYGYPLSICIQDYIKFGHFDEANGILRIIFADKNLFQLFLKEWRMMLYYYMTVIHLNKLNYKDAIKTHQKAMSYYNENYPLWMRLQMLINQEKIFTYQLRYKEAHQLQKRIYAIKDSLSSIRYVFDLSTSQERFEAENRERTLQEEIRKNNLENQRKVELLEKSKQVQILSWLLIVFLAVIIATISYQVKKIKVQSKQLAQANENKRNLLALIGHDLRAPILALYNSLKLIQISTPNAKKWASKQLPRVNSLLLATDNLLYWSHSQQEDKRTTPSKVNLFEIVAEVLDLLDANIEQAQINVENKLTTSTVIKVDQNHLRIIIRNVIQNAVKFTPNQGSIFITENELPKNIEIIIRDTGKGFEESKKDLSKQGTQLGLQVIEALTKANKGSVKIVSQKDTGTSVHLTFVKA